MPRDALRRLTSPLGSTVEVSAELAEHLLLNGYQPIEEKPKPAKPAKTTGQNK
jgi:hypothetical protein